MGSIAAAALFLLLAAVPGVFAVTFQVGDALAWSSGVDYTTWVTGKTFRVGDTLEFQYGPFHSVSVVDKAGYDNCDSSSQTQSFSGGDTKIDLTTVGTIHFICPTPGHCLGGMKLAVPVLAAAPTPATPSPPSSPRSPPPSPKSPPSSTPSPPPTTKSPPSSTPSPPLAPHSPPKPKTPPPSASPPATNSTPEYKSPTPSPSPSTTSPSPSPLPPNAASKGVISYGIIGLTMVLMYGLMS